MSSSDDITNPNPNRTRRPSVSQMLAAHRSALTTDTSPSVPAVSNPSMTSAVTAAAQQPHARRLSISALGLGTAVTPDYKPLDAAGIRRGGSIHSDSGRARHMSVSGGSESAVFDEPELLSPSAGSPSSGGSMARRMSQGARAYQSIRSAGTAPLPPIPSGPRSEGAVAVSPPAGNRMRMFRFSGMCIVNPETNVSTEGYNWGDTLRARAERGSISLPSKQPSSSSGGSEAAGHVRSASTTIAAPQQPIQQPQVLQLSKPVEKPQTKLDPTQERILRGTFLDM
jgi:hypothetical protein